MMDDGIGYKKEVSKMYQLDKFKGNYYVNQTQKLADWCEDHNLKYNRVFYLLKKGYTLDQILNKEASLSWKNITYKGITYRSINSFCSEHGLCRYNIYRNLKKGYDLETVLDAALNNRSVNRNDLARYNYKGKTYTLSELYCHEDRVAEVSLSAFINRILRYKWSIEKALTTQPTVGTGKEVIFRGKKYRSLTHLCTVMGVNESALFYRMKVKQQTIEEGLSHLLTRSIIK